ncbi:hypothetical protein [Halanaerobaculum tunisiense]
MSSQTIRVTRIALLAVLITVSGFFKIPGPAGSDFQLSAPMAVAIAAVFGFRRYILAGLISSGIGFILGTQTLIHILIAMIFRGVAGGLIAITCGAIWSIVIAGPLGSIIARLVLSKLLNQGFIPLLVSAVPGFIFTAIVSYPLVVILKRVIRQVDKEVIVYVD